jgi:hypothetical protein
VTAAAPIVVSGLPAPPVFHGFSLRCAVRASIRERYEAAPGLHG